MNLLQHFFFCIVLFFSTRIVLNGRHVPLGSLLFAVQNEYMKDNFLIKIETWHKPDLGHLENVTATEPTNNSGCVVGSAATSLSV